METVLNKSCLMVHMKTAFCPLCGAGISVVMRGDAKKEWKKCINCDELNYIEMSDEDAKVVSLQKIIEDVSSKTNGENLFKYLVKNESGATMHDLLFNSSKAVEPNILYMTELGLLVKEGDKYKLHPDLKEFVDQKFK